MTLRDYIYDEILDDIKLSQVYEDSQSCESCPIFKQCEKNDVSCWRIALDFLDKEID